MKRTTVYPALILAVCLFPAMLRAAPGEGPDGPRGERFERVRERILDQAGLSEEQRQRVMSMTRNHREETEPLREELRVAMRDLHELENDPAVSTGEVNAAIEQVLENQKKLMRARVMHKRELRAYLGEEKSEQLEQTIREAFRKLHDHRRDRAGQRPGSGGSRGYDPRRELAPPAGGLF